MIVLISLFALSVLLPLLSSYYFAKLMKFIKVRRGGLLVAGALTTWVGYIFFMLPWIFIGESIYAVRIMAYFLAFLGLLILSYGLVKIYIDWREVIK